MTRRRGPASGFAAVAVASAVAGALGYAITIVAARLLGADYAVFGVFWSAMYFVIGALAGGQQEFARMTRASGAQRVELAVSRSLWWFAAASAVIASLASLAALRLVFVDEAASLALALAVGLASYGVYAALLGTQYGARRWWVVATATVADPLIRLVAIVLAVQSGGGLVGAAWAAVVPFPLLVILLVVTVRRTAAIAIDRAPRAAVIAALTVVGGGVAASFLINGVPVLFRIVAPDETPSAVAGYVFAFILVRAPLVVGVLALQSFVIVTLRDHARPRRLAALLVLGTLGAAAVGAAGLSVAGEPLVAAVAGDLPSPSAALLVGIAVASGTTAALVITGRLALAEERRRAYSLGWWGSAIAVIAIALVLPGDAAARITVATIAGPLVGVAMHLAARSRGSSGFSGEGPPRDP